MSSSTWRDGDWMCANNHHCFRKYDQCRLCGSARPAHLKPHKHQKEGMKSNKFSAAQQQHSFGTKGVKPSFSSSSTSTFSHSQSQSHSQGSTIEKTDGRRYLDKMLKDKDAKIKSTADATLFLQAVIEYPKKEELLARLTSVREYGSSALVQALNNHDSFLSMDFLRKSVIPLLEWFGCDEFAYGASKRSLDVLLSTIVQQEQWLLGISELAQAEKLEVKDCTAIGWLLVQAVGATGEPGKQARALKDLILPIAEAMYRRRKEASYDGVRQLAQKLRVVLDPVQFAASDGSNGSESIDVAASASNFKTLADVKYLPGGRYDNDHAIFRDIMLLPTREEMAYKGEEYLPRDIAANEGSALDRWFRLLRYDFIHTIKEELMALKTAKGASTSSAADRRRRLYLNCHVLRFFSGLNSDAAPLASGHQPSSMINKGYFVVDFQHDAARPLRRSSGWWESHSRELDRDSLLCILVDQTPVCFAQVCERDPVKLANVEPRFGIVPCSLSAGRELTQLMLTKSHFQIFQFSASYFSVQPILERLQSMTRIPFATELIHYKDNQSTIWPSTLREHHPQFNDLVSKLANGGNAASLIRSKKLNGNLDKSQESAVLSGLAQRISFIQGPPGTGKSFVGALLAKAIFDTTDETILCVCYTNHALDQFLLDLVEHGIDMNHMVRIGSSKRINPQLSPILLHELSQNVPETQGIKGQIKTACESIEHLQAKLEKLSNRRRENLLFHLQKHQPEWYARFRVDPGQVNKDGLQMVGKQKNQKITIWSLLNSWVDGASAKGVVLEMLRLNNHDSNEELKYWSMPKNERRKQQEAWEQEISKDTLDEYDELITDLHREQQKRLELLHFRRRRALEDRRIIGCTTTAAAKYFTLLQHVQASVMIVEEAGEILEPHILAAMSDKIKHMIQIGDHKQLRPKTDTFELTVGHSNGYNLNLSMFERMVLKGFPHSTLSVQHRMHDDIACIVRQLTYQHLKTATTVTENSHPPIRGIQGRGRVMWVNHDKEEGMHNSLLMRDDSNATAHSKVNQHEATMIVRTARYLLQQGNYRAEQLVLLTPYLGQVTLIREELEKLSIAAILNAKDEQEIYAAAIAGDDLQLKQNSTSSSSSSKNYPQIKIATIDNYQGEEADIVLVSLVRSNKFNQIGFTGKPERVNVLMSRARHGMILFGDINTLTNQKPGNDEWKKVLAVSHPANAHAVDVRLGLAVVCARHLSEEQILKTPDDFDRLSPHGGCTKVCGARMACGKHDCPLTCHGESKLIQGADHAANSCKAKTISRCAANKHDIRHKCYQSLTKLDCKEIIESLCSTNRHKVKHQCGAPVPSCVECKQERLEQERAAAAEQERLLQLQMKLAHQEATFQIMLKDQQAKARIALEKKLEQIQLDHNKEVFAIKKAELEKQEEATLKQTQEEFLKEIEQLKSQVAAQQAKAAENPYNHNGASVAASSSSSSSSVAVAPKPPKKLFTVLKSQSSEFQSIAFQFFNSFAHMPAYSTCKFNVDGVHEIFSPSLKKIYDKAKEERLSQGFGEEQVVYHGTHPDNINNIAQFNLSMQHQGKLDPGWFGAGLYFSKHADYTMMYNTVKTFGAVKVGNSGRLFRFSVLPGRINQLEGMATGQPKKEGFDSNLTPNEYELVLFDNRFVLPTHVIDFSVSLAAGANFNDTVEKKGH